MSREERRAKLHALRTGSLTSTKITKPIEPPSMKVVKEVPPKKVDLKPNIAVKEKLRPPSSSNNPVCIENFSLQKTLRYRGVLEESYMNPNHDHYHDSGVSRHFREGTHTYEMIKSALEQFCGQIASGRKPSWLSSSDLSNLSYLDQQEGSFSFTKVTALARKAMLEIKKTKLTYIHYGHVAIILGIERSTKLFDEVIKQLFGERDFQPWIGKTSQETKEDWIEVSNWIKSKASPRSVNKYVENGIKEDHLIRR